MVRSVTDISMDKGRIGFCFGPSYTAVYPENLNIWNIQIWTKKSSFKKGHLGKFFQDTFPKICRASFNRYCHSQNHNWISPQSKLFEDRSVQIVHLGMTLTAFAADHRLVGRFKNFWLSNIGRFVDWLEMSSSYHRCVQMIVWIFNDNREIWSEFELGNEWRVS